MSVTFSRTTQTYTPTTGTMTSATTTVVGNAVRVRGDAEVYKSLGLIQSEAPTLFFTPTTYGQCPQPGDTVNWSSTTYTVRDVNPIAPDGTVIAARVVIVK